MSILDIECSCDSKKELFVDFTKKEGEKHILCMKCGRKWWDVDDWRPKKRTNDIVTKAAVERERTTLRSV
jgi:hypothetical protein